MAAGAATTSLLLAAGCTSQVAPVTAPSIDAPHVRLVHNGDLLVSLGQNTALAGIDPATGQRTHLIVASSAKVTAGGEIWDVDWSPDGTRVAYVFDCVGCPLGTAQVGIHVDLLASERSTPIKSAGPDGKTVRWSPDGAHIATVIDGQIVVMDPDGSNARTIPMHGLMVHSLTWSPSGDEIAFDATGSDPEDRSRSVVWVIAADGSSVRVIAPRGHVPSWSPDGTRIVYRRGCDLWAVSPNARDGSMLVHVPGHRRRCAPYSIFGDPKGQPRWSPDGRFLAFLGSRGQITIVRADGTHLHDVGRIHGLFAAPAWQPVP